MVAQRKVAYVSEHDPEVDDLDSAEPSEELRARRDRLPSLDHDHRFSRYYEFGGRGNGWSRTCQIEGCGHTETKAHDDMSQADFAAVGRRTYDWPTIKKMYVEGIKDARGDGHSWPALDDVARMNKVAANRVRERSAAEGWVAERQRWQQQLEQVRRQGRAHALSKAAMDLDSSALDAAKNGLMLCTVAEQAIANRVQAARQAGGPGAAVPIDALELQRLAAAIDLFHKVGLRAAGDPETHRVELTGAGGAPIEISQELRRDDPHRLADVLSVLRQAGLGDVFGADDGRALEAHRRDDGVYETLPVGR